MMDTGHGCDSLCFLPISLERKTSVLIREGGALCVGGVARRRRCSRVTHAHVPMTISKVVDPEFRQRVGASCPLGVHRHLCRSYLSDWITAWFVQFVWFVYFV
jgi:hypothetical protein